VQQTLLLQLPFFLTVHKNHNELYNPSPFAVIVGEYFEKPASEPVRSKPLLVLSMLLPVNTYSLIGTSSAEFL
jgi:hypothetical protein